MAKIFVGTSGYSYADWVGPFYPAGTAEKDFLGFYASQFSFVELNFSYYSMPSPPLIDRLAEKTGSDFVFAVKAHRSLTHEVTDGFERDLGAFREGVKPLAERGKLAAVLVQFPYSFHYNDQNRRRLDRLTRGLSGLPAAVEFRNAEWAQERVIEGLRERGAAFVNVDQPELPKLLKPGSLVTADHGYIRFHGRNKKNWWTGDNVSRYDYLYGEEELTGWIERIRSMLSLVRVLLITFNNHARGQAVQNARRLKELLAAEKIDFF
ncbi:MAG: DUF72 domain-containing protein [Spirochaetales bacterium]|nr:DUF72 domain-containing protein [Spirochaetales bacterium]